MTTTHLPLPAELPTTATTSVGDYPTYTAAQQAVDYLSDHGFGVQHTTIVGTDLRLVENVTGRMTITRAALAGAGGGAWLGLLIGAVLALFTTSGWWIVIAVATAGGAAWGATMAAAAHAATRGRATSPPAGTWPPPATTSPSPPNTPSTPTSTCTSTSRSCSTPGARTDDRQNRPALFGIPHVYQTTAPPKGP